MKKLLLFLTSSILLFSCENMTRKTYLDNRPSDEKAFIKVLADADSCYNSQTNNIKKHDVLDSDKTMISQYIINKLKLKVNNWVVFIDDIAVHQFDGQDFIEADLLIPKDTVLSDKYPQYDSIVLSAGVSVKPNKIKQTLSTLSKGEKVIISGVFMPNEDKTIDFDSNMMGEDELFSNPKFSFLIEDIKKI